MLSSRTCAGFQMECRARLPIPIFSTEGVLADVDRLFDRACAESPASGIISFPGVRWQFKSQSDCPTGQASRVKTRL